MNRIHNFAGKSTSFVVDALAVVLYLAMLPAEPVLAEGAGSYEISRYIIGGGGTSLIDY